MPRTSITSISNTIYKNESLLDSELLSKIDDNICKGILDKHVTDSYLSHWKSTIELLILKKRQTVFKEILTTSTDNTDTFTRIVLNNGLYKILIKGKNIPAPGVVSSDKNPFVDTIFINDNLNSIEKRCVIAHELGHIIINRFLGENTSFKEPLDFEQKEQLANLFMYYILWDKSIFYKEQAQDYQFNDLNEIKELMQKLEDTFNGK